MTSKLLDDWPSDDEDAGAVIPTFQDIRKKVAAIYAEALASAPSIASEDDTSGSDDEPIVLSSSALQQPAAPPVSAPPASATAARAPLAPRDSPPQEFDSILVPRDTSSAIKVASGQAIAAAPFVPARAAAYVVAASGTADSDDEDEEDLLDHSVLAHPLNDLESSWLPDDTDTEAEAAGGLVSDSDAARGAGGAGPEAASSVVGHLLALSVESGVLKPAEPLPPPPTLPPPEPESEGEDDLDSSSFEVHLLHPETSLAAAAAASAAAAAAAPALEADLEAEFLEETGPAVSDGAVRRYVAKRKDGAGASGAAAGLDIESSLASTDLDLDGLLRRAEAGMVRAEAGSSTLPPADSLFDDLPPSASVAPRPGPGGNDWFSAESYKARAARRARTEALKTPGRDQLGSLFTEEDGEGPGTRGQDGRGGGDRHFAESISILERLTEQLRRDQEEADRAGAASGPHRISLVGAAAAVPSAAAAQDGAARPRASDRFMNPPRAAAPPPGRAAAESSSDEEVEDLRAARSRIKSGRNGKARGQGAPAPKPRAPQVAPGPAAAAPPAPAVDRSLLDRLVNDVLTHPRKEAANAKAAASDSAAASQARAAAVEEARQERAAVEEDPEVRAMEEEVRRRREAREGALDLEMRRLGVKELLQG